MDKRQTQNSIGTKKLSNRGLNFRTKFYEMEKNHTYLRRIQWGI